MHGSQFPKVLRRTRARRTRAELTVDDIWQIADAGDQELRSMARTRRGTLEPKTTMDCHSKLAACTALAEE